MEGGNKVAWLLQYLQDPHHVARFQQFCGVRGTFSRSSPLGSSTNGACSHQRAEGSEEKCTAGDGEGGGENTTTTAGVRQRTVGSTTTGDCTGGDGKRESPPPQNGVAVGHAGEGESAGRGGKNDRGAQTGSGCLPGESADERVGQVPSLPKSGTVKPLRKNSLTGDVGQEFLIEDKFLFYLFTFGTELGNELFYIIFFPFVMWNVDAFVSRRLIMVWVWVMYLGQCTKDVFRWSRPASPPVVKVEMFYNSEYSMPSTHAMSGTAIPFSLFILTYGRWEYPFAVGFSLALCWSLLVCVSRIYMGMHSILDVIVGFLYSVLILIIFLPNLDLIDNFNLTCSYAPAAIVFVHLAAGFFSFTLDTWSTSRGDTAQILGTGAGIALGSHVNSRLGLMTDLPVDQIPFAPSLGAGLLGVAVTRHLLGVLVLVASRALMKALAIPLVCRLTGIPGDDVRKARQHMEVELPYRYIVYGTVGFNVIFLVPLLFRYLQLS